MIGGERIRRLAGGTSEFVVSRGLHLDLRCCTRICFEMEMHLILCLLEGPSGWNDIFYVEDSQF
jgi:hypothetical protein